VITWYGALVLLIVALILAAVWVPPVGMWLAKGKVTQATERLPRIRVLFLLAPFV
jgi:Tfp pilus assembly major pilin PilA